MAIYLEDFGLKERLSEAANRKVKASILQIFKEEGALTERDIKTKGISSGGGPPASRSRSRSLFTRSGMLRRSIGFQVQRAGDGTLLRVGMTETSEAQGAQGSPLVYAGIHERGGVIKPKTKKFLTIPLPASYTPAGVKRWTAGELKEDPSPFDNTFVQKTKKTSAGGNLMIFGERDGKLTPLFLLRRSVKIPARPFVRPWFDKMRKRVVKRLIERLGDDVNG